MAIDPNNPPVDLGGAVQTAFGAGQGGPGGLPTDLAGDVTTAFDVGSGSGFDLADAVFTAFTAGVPGAASGFYQFVDAEQITIYVPPNSSKQAWQVRGVEPHSGIVFLSIIGNKAFHTAGYVKYHMNNLGHVLNLESLVPNVVGIAVHQTQDAQNQLVNVLDVTVESTSGNSEGRITVPYPNPADSSGSVAAFTGYVNAEVAVLNANEAS